MADVDYGGEEFGDYYYEDDWLYIEDEVAVSDELAETQCPSPGYAGTSAELMLESYEYDTYEYFGELEYGSDSYWDITVKRRQVEEEAMQYGGGSPRKRKRASTSNAIRHEKRRRVIRGASSTVVSDDTEAMNVIFRSSGQAAEVAPILSTNTPAFALFPDWRERFPADANIAWKYVMPEDMRRAAEEEDAEAQDEVETLIQQSAAANTTEAEHRSKRRIAELGDSQQKEMSPSDLLSSMDPEALRTILRSKLGDAALDEETFMTAISSMLSGTGSADDAAAQLAGILLEQQGDNSEAAMSWLQGRGVNMDVDDPDDDQSDQRVNSATSIPSDAAQAMSDLNLSRDRQDSKSQRDARTRRPRSKQ